ncbi:MAG TPA: ATP-binding protein [Allosphingosinicella sp.]
MAPAVLDVAANPLELPDPVRLAATFVDMISEGPIDHDQDEALNRILAAEPVTMRRAMVAFFAALRDGFAASEHWRDLAQLQVGAEILAGMNTLLSRRPTFDQDVNPEAALEDARRGSEELRAWPRDIWGSQLTRPEFASVVEALREDPRCAILLVGEAGSGKSAFMAELVDALAADGVAVLAIKADRLPADVRNFDDVASALNMAGPLVGELHSLAAAQPVALLIDQLDAVSDVMDRRSARMQLLLRLISEARGSIENGPPISVIVSSRPFEADHDARFQQLGARQVILNLPSDEQVAALLAEIGIDPTTVPAGLASTLRRPFALKLFVDLVKRGVAVDELLPSQLLQRWLDTVPFDAEMRRSVASLMTDLAAEMVLTETLWRPADRFSLDRGPELQAAEACGLVVRDGTSIGFSHQSWLDDFQARNFVTGIDLAEFAWRGQDSLFPRAAVLRGMQRLRQVELAAYLDTIDRLLGKPQTRRHLQHLVVDMLALSPEPLPREIAWVQRLIGSDLALAKRALSRIVRVWAGWREAVMPWLPQLAGEQEFEWHVASMLVEEGRHAPETVAAFLEKDWAETRYDKSVAFIAERLEVWLPTLAARLNLAVRRQTLDPFAVSHLLDVLRQDGRVAEALEVVETYIRTAEAAHGRLDIYGLEKLGEADSLQFCERLFPWFVEIATSDISPDGSLKDGFSTSNVLEWDWKYEDESGRVIKVLREALRALAERDPQALLELLSPYLAVQVEEVQTVIADALAAAGPPLANRSLAFLLEDTRRLYLGDAHGTGTDGIGRTISGWSAQQLVRAIVPGLEVAQLEMLKNAILAWKPYSEETWSSFSAAEKKLRLPWNEAHRFALLEPLPVEVLGTRLRRRISEWRRTQPVFKSRMNTIGMVRAVGSPMATSAMEKASNDQILRMLNEVDDGVDDPWPERSRRRPYSGGISQLAHAFGAFAKNCPERALIILEKLQPAKHEHAAGAALRELATVAEPGQVAELIHRFAAMGFSSSNWRNDCGWAFQALSGRAGGLADGDIALLESWIVRDKTQIDDEVVRRRLLDERNREQNSRRTREKPEPILFGRGGGSVIVPQKNYTFLEAIALGWLQRDPPNHQAWSDALERHLEEPEDPAIWAHLIRQWGQSLWWIEKAQAERIWRRFLERQPEAFDDPSSVGALWQLHATVPTEVRDAILERWLQGEAPLPQMAGELAAGVFAVEPDDSSIAEFVIKIREEPGPARTGFLFSLAAAWREDSQAIRSRVHEPLLAHAAEATGDEATAVAKALDRRETVPADARTIELLAVVCHNAAVLDEASGRRLAETLQQLLLHPGFDEPVMDLLEAVISRFARSEQKRFGLDTDYVQLAVALQRNEGALRRRAMDVYEHLLDAGAYGAEEAAEAAMRR